MAENIRWEVESGIGLLTIARPKAMNALNADTMTELEELFTKVATDSSVKAVIITGDGEKAFVAGADISHMATMNAMEGRAWGEFGQRVFQMIENLPQPVIAAVKGFALGGGCELSMACDFRIASENAKFGQPEVTLGIPAGFGGTQRMPRLIGKGRAKELLYTGDMINAEEALKIGLVNHVVPLAELLDKAKAIAAKIVERAPLAVQITKAAINRGTEMDQRSGISYEAEVFGLMFSTEDQKEGMAAFLEKRKANFKGC